MLNKMYLSYVPELPGRYACTLIGNCFKRLKRAVGLTGDGMCCRSLCCSKILPSSCTSISTSSPSSTSSHPLPHSPFVPAKPRDRPSLLSLCWPTSRAGNHNGRTGSACLPACLLVCLPAQPLSQQQQQQQHLEAPRPDVRCHAMQCHAMLLPCHVDGLMDYFHIYNLRWVYSVARSERRGAV